MAFVRLLQHATAAAAAATLVAITTAYDTSMGPIKPVAEADRLSATQLFRRDVDITSPLSLDLPYIDLDVDVPGRVYVTHVDDPTTASFAKVSISGSSEGAVEYVTFDASTTEADDLVITTMVGNFSATGTDSLLVEIQLFVKHSLRSFSKKGSSDAVVLENVLYSPAANTSEVSDFGTGSLFGVVYGNGSLYVSDPKGELAADSIDIIVNAQGTGNIQIELATLTQTSGNLTVLLGQTNKVTLFVDELGPISAGFWDEATEASPTSLCIASKADVTVSSGVADQMASKTSVRASGSTCEKMPLPERVPAPIHEEVKGGTAAVATTTAPPVAATSTASVSRITVWGGFAVAGITIAGLI